MHIPFFRPPIGDEEISAVTEVLRSGWLTTGPKTAQFEREFSAFLGGGVESVAVNSATAGLHLALEALGIGPGDAVIVPTLTFTATAEVVRYLGAEVVLADVDPDTQLLDLEDCRKRLTANCKAIMPVHFAGMPCDMTRILEFARAYGLKVVEDAAHALPAHRDGRMVGTFDSDACIFSFYANKTITTGEGGMLVTSSPAIAARARTMRTHGINRDAFDRFRKVGASWDYDIVAPGFKYNMTDIAAAIGVVQLSKARDFQAARQAAAERYIAKLSNLPLKLPRNAPPGSSHAWHLFPIRVSPEADITRDELIDALNKSGIGSSVHYRPLHRMKYWRERYPSKQGSFPVADDYFEQTLTLPLFPGILDAEIDQICNVIKTSLRK
ncbi:DegT/DnrJ/EryC1/StrS family aminotransferase [Methylocystis sp. JAN1]|uniref:DegT/DnrJ/EryC1/StrS family aminotransferase n=1 Tax=Methylocystis sp. JAN1 TaxID=3397211 RepID=UPI003FA1CE30